MFTRLDAADRLVRLVDSRGTVGAEEAAVMLLALAGTPRKVAMTVLERVVAEDARLVWGTEGVSLAPSPLASVPLGRAAICVIDLETSSLRANATAVTELAAVRLNGGRPVRELEVAGPGASSPVALRGLSHMARRAAIAGHNVRFDLRFLDELTRAATGARVAAPVVDTLVLARRLLGTRIERHTLDALAEFFGVPDPPCHRALADARATAAVLVRLVELARERGAATLGDLCALARPARRTVG